LVGCLLYRSPGATTHTWSDCFSALTRGLWNRSTCILLKNHGSLDKTYTKKSSSGKFVQAKRTQYLMAKPCKKDGCQFWFSLISKSHPFFMAFFMAFLHPLQPWPWPGHPRHPQAPLRRFGARSGCFAVPAARQQHRQGGHQLAQSYLGPWGDGWNMLKWGRGRDGCRWLVNVSKIL
jgi:hypothetical protein